MKGLVLTATFLPCPPYPAYSNCSLSSTWLLNRITMVHHAALNCIRRIFAIVATSIIFRIPMTGLGVFGVLVSMAGFLSFTHAKANKSSRRPPTAISSLPSPQPPPQGSTHLLSAPRRPLTAPGSGGSIGSVGRSIIILSGGDRSKER